MHDRNVEHPNRYRMVKVEGTDDIYDMIPAPGVVNNEGTLINKATMLKDATAALFGMGADAVPDDVFKKLSNLVVYNWKRRTNSEGWVETKVTGTEGCWYTAYTSGSIYYADSYTVDANGNATLVNPVCLINSATPNANSVKDKYVPANKYVSRTTAAIKASGRGDDDLGYVSTQTQVSADQNNFKYYILGALPVKLEYKTNVGEWEFVSSENENAYPHSGISGGYEYEFLGTVVSRALGSSRIETGSYVGTGETTNTAGYGYRTSLTFSFEPKVVIIRTPTPNSKNNHVIGAIYLRGMELAYNTTYGTSSSFVYLTWNGRTVSWYSTAGHAGDQLNHEGATYYYAAFA